MIHCQLDGGGGGGSNRVSSLRLLGSTYYSSTFYTPSYLNHWLLLSRINNWRLLQKYIHSSVTLLLHSLHHCKAAKYRNNTCLFLYFRGVLTVLLRLPTPTPPIHVQSMMYVPPPSVDEERCHLTFSHSRPFIHHSPQVIIVITLYSTLIICNTRQSRRHIEKQTLHPFSSRHRRHIPCPAWPAS